MSSPRYTVIVPMLRFRAEEPVLASLRATPPASGTLEILVAEGHQPARQRNLALAHARGEIVVFLDNDCALDPDYWSQLDAAFSRPGVDIVGGPALLRAQATSWEKIFHALLTHTLLVGTVSARYAPRGAFRPATQTDLILCNLAARRAVFQRIGPLSTELYPNEENEWLDRARHHGIGAFYDPALRVHRPQRASPGQMALTLLRYGMGRTRQFRVSRWRFTFHQILPLLPVAAVFALIHWQLEEAFVFLWLLAAAVITLTCDPLLKRWQQIVAGLIAPLIPLTYALGQALGWFALFLPARQDPVGIILRDERGGRVA